MLRVANEQQLGAAYDSLVRLLRAVSSETRSTRLSTPGTIGSPVEATLLRPHERLWAHFSGRPYDELRWECWYWTQVPPGIRTLTPSIEINIPTMPRYPNGKWAKATGGRVLVDERENLYLGHKGILRGGRGGDVSMNEFEKLIRGFEKEPVLWPDDSEERIFVIGRIGGDGFLDQLSAFTAEAERLREIARKGRKTAEIKKIEVNSGGFTPGSHGLTDGTRSSIDYKIDRRHEKIVEALHARLANGNIKASNKRIQGGLPDLYTQSDDGSIDLLFEVKTWTNTQSWYTAIGQLMVYGAVQPLAPRRFLVCPSLRADLCFAEALRKLEIRVITYDDSDLDNVTFGEIEQVFGGARN